MKLKVSLRETKNFSVKEVRNMETCNRLENGRCDGCNIPTIVWHKANTREDVDPEAIRISEQYCPTDSGGIDYQARAVIYNNKPEKKVESSHVW